MTYCMYDRVKDLLNYDPESGDLIWRVRWGRACPGDVANNKSKNGYLRVGIDGKKYFAHRVAWLLFYGQWPKHQIDHINGDRTDNRINNLRDITPEGNQQNLRSQTANKAGVLGVYKRGPNTFVAQICQGGKIYYGGTYSTAEKAHAARLCLERKYHKLKPLEVTQ